MKVTITGASGFVGQNLTKYLKSEGEEVQEVSLRDKDWENKLAIPSDVIIHLAGKAHDTSNTSSSEEYFEINTELTKEVFDLFLASGAKDFIYFSSVKATADSVVGVLDETHDSSPKTPYGKSKLMAEEHLLSYSLPSDKRVLIIRPCMIHGEGNKGNLNLLYKIVRKGMPWPLASFENKRSFLSIDNLNYLILKLIRNKNVKSGIFNFADDEAISTNELVKIIAEASSQSPRLWSLPSAWILFVAKIGDKIKLPLNSERLKKLTESYVVSNEKVKTALNIGKLPVSVREGLYKTIKSFEK